MPLSWNEIKGRAIAFAKEWSTASDERAEAQSFWIEFFTVFGLSPKRISSLINLWGFTLMTPFGLVLALGFDFGAVQSGTWMLLVFYALAASMGTVWLWMTGSRHLPAAQGGIFTVFLPISAALVGVLVLGESLAGMQVLAFAIALLGVALTWNHEPAH